jgi:hypothetical protein
VKKSAACAMQAVFFLLRDFRERMESTLIIAACGMKLSIAACWVSETLQLAG